MLELFGIAKNLSLEHASNHQSACMCEHNPTRAERSEQCVQSVSSSTFEPAVCCDKPFLEMLSINLAGARSEGEGRFCRFRGNTEAFYRNMVYHHHPRPGIYNAVLRSDRFGTGHRLGIQNAPAGGPLQITDLSAVVAADWLRLDGRMET